MRPPSSRFAFIPLLLIACNGQVASEGTGGSTSATTSSSSTTSSTSTSSGDGGPCLGWVEVTVESNMLQFQSNCASDTWNPGMSATPSGYIWAGGPPPGGTGLNVFGCATEAAGSQGLTLAVPGVTAPGPFNGGGATYTDVGGAVWSSAGTTTVVITTLSAVGGIIQGTFSATVVDSPSKVAEDISGSFSVCHTEDELAP